MHTKLITLTAIVAVCAIPDAAAATAPAPTTFSSTQAEQTYTVPAGVHTVHVTAIGAPGGAGAAGRAPGRIIGGLGAVVGADLSVTPGEVLYVEVGGAGGLGDADTGGLPGWNGGGAGGDTSSATGAFGGGGGGASDVRLCSIAAANCPQGSSLGSRILVAGGGGGGGGGQVNGDLGGQGGNAGKVDSAGFDRAGFGGGGATQSAAGTGGHGRDCGNVPTAAGPAPTAAPAAADRRLRQRAVRDRLGRRWRRRLLRRRRRWRRRLQRLRRRRRRRRRGFLVRTRRRDVRHGDPRGGDADDHDRAARAAGQRHADRADLQRPGAVERERPTDRHGLEHRQRAAVGFGGQLRRPGTRRLLHGLLDMRRRRRPGRVMHVDRPLRAGRDGHADRDPHTREQRPRRTRDGRPHRHRRDNRRLKSAQRESECGPDPTHHAAGTAHHGARRAHRVPHAPPPGQAHDHPLRPAPAQLERDVRRRHRPDPRRLDAQPRPDRDRRQPRPHADAHRPSPAHAWQLHADPDHPRPPHCRVDHHPVRASWVCAACQASPSSAKRPRARSSSALSPRATPSARIANGAGKVPGAVSRAASRSTCSPCPSAASASRRVTSVARLVLWPQAYQPASASIRTSEIAADEREPQARCVEHLLGSGYRATADALDESGREALRRRVAETLRAQDVAAVRTDVVHAIARK